MIEAFITGAVGAAIVAVVGNVIMFKLQRKAAKEDKEDTKLETRIESQEKEQAVIKDGVKALLHDRLYHTCKFYLQRGEITITEMSNIEYLYNSYHALGGNGTGTELYKRVKELPVSQTEHEILVEE